MCTPQRHKYVSGTGTYMEILYGEDCCFVCGAQEFDPIHMIIPLKHLVSPAECLATHHFNLLSGAETCLGKNPCELGI